MKALNKALLRDLWRLRAQVITLTLVVTAGAGFFVAEKMNLDVLSGSRDSYFRAQRFADAFGSLKRAPRALLAALAALDGVAEIEGRVVGSVPMFVRDNREPATVELVSIDPQKLVPLNAVRLQRGRMPSAYADNELVLNEPFADANLLRPGDSVNAVINGRLRALLIVGVGISPEFVFQLPPGVLSPNDARYGVAWMSRAPLEAAFDMRGSFNDIVLRLAPNVTSSAAVIDALDRRLAPYGGRGAYGRVDQPSARFLDGKIAQIAGMMVILPGLFLLVAAFVLQVVLGRLVHSQREIIGALKAFGYTNARLAVHYFVLAVLAVLPGALAGIVGGMLLGEALVHLYVHYFRLPLPPPSVDWAALAGALLVVFAAAAIGTAQAMTSVIRLLPVEAMRPATPPTYKRGVLERWHLSRRIPPALLMVFRHLRIAPGRALASVLTLAFATALCLSGSFMSSAIDALVHHQFDVAMSEDIAVSFASSVGADACHSLTGIDGIVRCEPLYVIAVRAKVAARSERVAITALIDDAQLRRIIDTHGDPVALPPTGLLVSRRLANKLGVAVGGDIIVETVEGRPRSVALPVRALVDDEFGLNLYMTTRELTTFLQGVPPMTIALLRIAPGSDARVSQKLAGMPSVVGASRRSDAILDFETTQGKSMRVMIIVLALLASVLAIAVVYNGARVVLAEHARDLASLRVLGFTQREVSALLLGEMGVELVLGIPLGLWFGNLLGHAIVVGAARDEFRLPFVMLPSAYVTATLVVVAAAFASTLHLRGLIDRLDLVEVLKTRD